MALLQNHLYPFRVNPWCQPAGLCNLGPPKGNAQTDTLANHSQWVNCTLLWCRPGSQHVFLAKRAVHPSLLGIREQTVIIIPKPHGSWGLPFVPSSGTMATIRTTLHHPHHLLLLLSGHEPCCRGFLLAFCAQKTTTHLTTFYPEGAFSSWPSWEYNSERQRCSLRALRSYAWFYALITVRRQGNFS